MSAYSVPLQIGKILIPNTLDLSRVFVRCSNGDCRITFEAIKTAVAQSFGVSVEQINSRRRDGRIPFARQVAMHLCRELLGASTTELAKHFKRTGHSTICWASTHVLERMDTEPKVREHILKLQAQLGGM